MAYYVYALKQIAIDPTMSDEEFVRNLFIPYINAGMVKDKNKTGLDLNKSRVSRLLTQKDDVPTAMRNALAINGIYENTKAGFAAFVEDYLDKNRLSVLIHEMDVKIRITPSVASESKKNLTDHANDAVEYLCLAFFEAIRIDNRQAQQSDKYLWHRGTNSLQLIFGDLFKYGFGNRKKQQSIVVIPVNTAFDTHVSWKSEGTEDPVVSPLTLHGQWIDRWLKAGNTIEQLNGQIEANLTKQNREFTFKQSKKKSYNIGSIAVVSNEHAIYYLLAISEFDEQNIAHSTELKIREAIRSLMLFYNHFGMGYPMYLPLMGTGRSRAALDYQASFDIIREEILRDTQLIQGQITIVASKEAMKTLNMEAK